MAEQNRARGSLAKPVNHMENYVLFYPTIEFQDFEWLWRASLLYDRIYRIVPRSYEPDEPRNIQELCATGEIGAPIRPDHYIAEIAQEFIESIESNRWGALALSIRPGNIDRSQLHEDKCDEALRRMVIAKGGLSSSDGFLSVSGEFAATYMIYLATHIAEKNKLEITTDSLNAWTAAAYFQHNGQMEAHKVAVWDQLPFEQQLAAMIISDFLPSRVLQIRPRDILSFRSRFREERHNFMAAVRKAAALVAQCTDPAIVADVVSDAKKEVDSGTNDLRKALSFLNVKQFTGIKALSLPIAAAISSHIERFDPELATFVTIAGAVLTGYSVVREAVQNRATIYFTHLLSC